MTINPAGFQVVSDAGAPRVFTAVAKQAVSGGMFVFVSGAAATVSSGANSFAFGDISVYGGNAASGVTCNGIAMRDAASGEEIAVLRAGDVLVTAAANIVAGVPVACIGSNSVATAATFDAVIGRALTEASSGGYVLVSLLL